MVFLPEGRLIHPPSELNSQLSSNLFHFLHVHLWDGYGSYFCVKFLFCFLNEGEYALVGIFKFWFAHEVVGLLVMSIQAYACFVYAGFLEFFDDRPSLV